MCAYLCMRTTIELPYPLFRCARAAAHERGMTLKELFTEALDKVLKSPVKGPKRMDKPPVSGGAGRRIPARTNKELGKKGQSRVLTLFSGRSGGWDCKCTINSLKVPVCLKNFATSSGHTPRLAGLVFGSSVWHFGAEWEFLGPPHSLRSRDRDHRGRASRGTGPMGSIGDSELLAPRCFKWVKTRYRGIIRKSGTQEKKGRNAGYQPPRR